jgi:hypothetical protein
MNSNKSGLYNEIMAAVNRCCAENGSNTPDFILARFLLDSLAAFDNAVLARSNWYGDRDGTVESHHRFDAMCPSDAEADTK